MRHYYDRGKQLLDRHKKRIAPLILIGGFAFETLTYREIDPATHLLVKGAYVLAAFLGVTLGERGTGPLRRYMQLAVQFAFGALLSTTFLFYWFGGSVAGSWPLLLLVAVLVAFNEKFREHLLRPKFQFAMFAFTCFTYCTLLVPFLVRSVSAWAFLLGGAAATGLSFALVEAITRTDPARAPSRRWLQVIAGGTFIAFSAAYALNVIPPIPLAIRDAGVYHDVKSADGKYSLQGEPENFLQRLWPGQTIHLEHDGDSRIYVYTAIYAPASLSTTIAHHWQRQDAASGKWVDMGRNSYTTRGGRQDGYRGYSYRTITTTGEWRVIVESARGQELGRVGFTVVE